MPLLRTALLIAGLSLAQGNWFTGSWSGSFATDHGTSPLSIKADAAKKSAEFSMEFMGSPLSGAVDSLKTSGDSVSFAIGFDTPQGRGTFRFRGLRKGRDINGQFQGFLDKQEMSRGQWSLKQAP